jgi:ABC-2 type transport system permease protein
MLTRIWTLTVKELIQLWRDKLILLFVFLGPAAELSLVAWSTSGDIDHIPTAIVDRDRTAASRALVLALENTETFDATYYPLDEVAAAGLVDSGAALVMVVIPPGFEEQISVLGNPAQVQVILDGADPSAARVAEMSAEGAVAAFAQKIALERFGHVVDQWGEVIEVDMRVWFNE